MFFVSGAAGLIFEVVWFVRCGLVFGNSVWATSIVLSSFMAGLAVGNALCGLFGARFSRPLLAYAGLEAIAGVTGILVTYALVALPPVVASVTGGRLDSGPLLNAVRLIAAFLILVVPTTAIGATLPILVAAMSDRGVAYGRVLGTLYGWNTLGAVTGVLVTELLLIAQLGVNGSAWVAGGLNCGAAAGALWLARGCSNIPRREHPGPTINRAALSRGLLCAFLAGGNLLAFEVVWFRFLSMFVVASTRSVSLILAVVLSAIGLGGLAASAWLRRRPDADSQLPVIACLAAVVSVASYLMFGFVAVGPWAAEWYRILWFAFALTFPTATLSGVLFTLIGTQLRRSVGDDTGATAWTTLANTGGGVVGPLAAAFVLLPLIGLERTVLVLAGVYAAVGALTTAVLPGRRMAAVAAAVFAGLVVLAAVRSGSTASGYFARAIREYTIDGSRLIARREGSAETIFLTEKSWLGKPLFHRLITNSFSMSGTQIAARRYMRYFAYWPMILHRGPLRRVLVVCYGVGVTAGAVTDISSVTSIDVVEISRDVVAMSDLIYPPESRPLADPRVRLHVEDGRNFLQTSAARFDLITGEPPPPLTPGTVNLYTREYFQLAYDRLADGGMLTYWLPVARRGEYDVKSIIRAFCEVFADCALWNGTPLDWMLTGTRQATGSVSAAQFGVLEADGVASRHLREIGFERPEQIGATFLGDAPYLREITADTLPLTDNHPQRLRPRPENLSLRRPADPVAGELGFVAGLIDPARAREAFRRSPFIQRFWPPALVTETLPYFEHQRAINRSLLDGANPLRQIEELHALLTRTPLRTLPLWALGSDDVQQRIAADEDDGSFMVSYVIGVRELAARSYSAAAASFAEAERRGLRAATSRPLLVYALCLAGQLDTAEQLSQGPMPTDPDRRHFWQWIGAQFGVGPGARHF